MAEANRAHGQAQAFHRDLGIEGLAASAEVAPGAGPAAARTVVPRRGMPSSADKNAESQPCGGLGLGMAIARPAPVDSAIRAAHVPAYSKAHRLHSL
jgi:hypothetical protein